MRPFGRTPNRSMAPAVLLAVAVFAVPAAAGSLAYVTNQDGHSVSVIDLDSGRTAVTLNVGQGPAGIAVSRDGRRAFVSDPKTGRVYRLNGRTHDVITAVVLMRRDPKLLREATVRSQVTFRELTPQEIDGYADSEEGLDKAGGYGIQARGRDLIARFTGSSFHRRPRTAPAEKELYGSLK